MKNSQNKTTPNFCAHCGSEMEKTARFCAHCSEPRDSSGDSSTKQKELQQAAKKLGFFGRLKKARSEESEPKKVAKGCLVFIFIVIFIALLSSGEDTENTENQYSSLKSEVTARICIENEVEQNLKLPHTAEFEGSWSQVSRGTMIKESSPNVFAWKSFVDSQNIFGATIRTNFICTTTVIDNDKFLCDTKCVFN